MNFLAKLHSECYKYQYHWPTLMPMCYVPSSRRYNIYASSPSKKCWSPSPNLFEIILEALKLKCDLR